MSRKKNEKDGTRKGSDSTSSQASEGEKILQRRKIRSSLLFHFCCIPFTIHSTCPKYSSSSIHPHSFIPNQFHLPTSPLNQRYPIYTHTHIRITHYVATPPKNRMHRLFIFIFLELVPSLDQTKPKRPSFLLSTPPGSNLLTYFNTNCTYPALSLASWSPPLP